MMNASCTYLAKPRQYGRSGYTSSRTKPSSNSGSDRENTTSPCGNKSKNMRKSQSGRFHKPLESNMYGELTLKYLPDYTDTAYRDAVNKLKYFLNGSGYAAQATIQAAGGSSYHGSVKNLNETDLENTSKLYAVVPTTNTSRPRLASKYAVLYADSLRNTPCGNDIFQSHVDDEIKVDDQTGTAPDVINFIQKQEEYIQQLERESQCCREELTNLLGKVKEVISENESLHEAKRDRIISKMFDTHYDVRHSDTDAQSDADDKVPSKKKRESYREKKLEGPNIVFESKISELQAQLTQSKIDLKKTQEENVELKSKMAANALDTNSLDAFKRQIENLQRDKKTLESQMERLRSSMEHRPLLDRVKSNEPPTDSERQMKDERNALQDEVNRLKGELSSQRARLRELSGEGARRAIKERSEAEMRYSTHIDDLSNDLTVQYDNVAKLQLELERHRRMESDLKRELALKNAALEELRMEIKNKTAGLITELNTCRAEKCSLEDELASARLSMERHQRQAKSDQSRANAEIQSLRQRLDRADAELVHSRCENLRLNEQIANLEKEINIRSISSVPERDRNTEIASMIHNVENKHAVTVTELQNMIQTQNVQMDKLNNECKLLKCLLQDESRMHKQEMAALQQQVEAMMTSQTSLVQHSQAPATEYANGNPYRSSDNTDYDYGVPVTANHTAINRQQNNGYLNHQVKPETELTKPDYDENADTAYLNQNQIPSQYYDPNNIAEIPDSNAMSNVYESQDFDNPDTRLGDYNQNGVHGGESQSFRNEIDGSYNQDVVNNDGPDYTENQVYDVTNNDNNPDTSDYYNDQVYGDNQDVDVSYAQVGSPSMNNE